ncbi:replication protein A 70 kDa DNA-binding subunit B [Tanacetum coccineum]
MGYQKSPSLSNNTYRKNGGARGPGSFAGSQSLSKNNYRKNVVIEGSISSRGHGGSKSIDSTGGSGGNGKYKKITPISEVDPMLDDISIQGKCVSIWHSHRMNVAHDPYSLDLVLQDAHVGQCYILSNFDIANNSVRLPLLPHRYKISFYKCTTITRIEPFDNNTNGFILEPFNYLLDPKHRQYYENDVVARQSEILGRVQERYGYEANQVKIELFSPEVKVVFIAEFFHGAINRMVGGIHDSEPDSYCIVYARIHRIYKEHEHGNVQHASRFKVIVRVIDKSGSAPLLFFNNNFVKLYEDTAWELIEKYNMDPDEYWHEELDNIIGKKCLFKIFYSEYNVAKNNHTYRCDSFSEDVELINHFKKNFIRKESDDEDSVDEHDSDMHTTTKTRESTSSVEVSSSKKRKLNIDLDEVKSQPKEGNITKAHELVAVKIKLED